MEQKQKSPPKKIVLHVLTFLFVVAAGTGLFALLAGETPAEQGQEQYPVEVDVAKLTTLTEDLEPNPHSTHLGELECAECHQAQETSEIICAQCHFQFAWYEQLIERNKKLQ